MIQRERGFPISVVGDQLEQSCRLMRYEVRANRHPALGAKPEGFIAENAREHGQLIATQFDDIAYARDFEGRFLDHGHGVDPG